MAHQILELGFQNSFGVQVILCTKKIAAEKIDLSWEAIPVRNL